MGDLYNTKKWMSSVDNAKLISDLSIPGTHNSGAEYYNPLNPIATTARCQSTLINEQLDNGVRFLDIRCIVDKDTLKVYHGIVNERLTFDEIIKHCKNFLKNNPTETILFSLKNENGKLDEEFEAIFRKQLNEDSNLWFVENKIPAIHEVRGKIVLFRRFKIAPGSLGINVYDHWHVNNPHFEIQTTNSTIHIQDKYEVKTSEEKFDYVKKMLDEANSDSEKNHLYMNFASGYTQIVDKIPNLRDVCNVVNPLIELYLKKSIKGRYGVLLMDFVEPEIIKQLIKSNI